MNSGDKPLPVPSSSCGANPAKIATRPRFGHCHGADKFARGQPWQPPLALIAHRERGHMYEIAISSCNSKLAAREAAPTLNSSSITTIR